MSAIYGIINKNGKPVEQETINKIKHAIAHRAKDGQGLWHIDNCALGFCKLTVYQQQQNEQLPIEAGDLIITADVRIDNRDELYSLLNLDKRRWETEADAHIILKAYQQWGEQCVDRLQGEFVFALWDKIKQRLFLAADQIGFRPVFYYDGPEQFIFCSEIKGVVAGKGGSNYFNEEHLINYHFKQGDPVQTYNKEVFALCGGNSLSLRNGSIQIKKYWTLQANNRYNFSLDEDWIACMHDLIYKAVGKRLNADVPVGITLSGGLDSGSIACILSELLAKKNKPLYAFSSVLPVDHGGIEVDERNYINALNKHYPNIIQTFVEAPNLGPFDNVEDAFIKDESLPNSSFYIDNALLKAAQDKNIRSLFSGFGGDFWVSWSGRSIIYLLMKQGKYKTAGKVIKQLSLNYNVDFFSLIRSDYLTYTPIWKQLRKLKSKKTIDWQQETTLKPELVNKYSHLFDLKSEPDQRLTMQAQLQGGSIGRIAGMFANRNSWYDIAPCHPMLDKDLMEFLIEVPVHLFNQGGWRRSLIRHAMDGVLPSEIQWRKDKLPYSPDFARRSMFGRNKLDNIITAEEHSFIFEKYISRKTITDHFEDIKPFAGFSSPSSLTGIRIAQAGIVCQVLSYLNKNDYRFI